MWSQVVCSGCRNVLLYDGGATSVSCALCNTITSVPPTENNQIRHILCGNCRTTLMNTYGAPSVYCGICHYITNVNMTNGSIPIADQRPNGTTNSETVSSTLPSMPRSQSQTVVVENPMSVDSSGNLVSNVGVGITTDKK